MAVYVDISSNNGTPNLPAYKAAGHADLMLKATEGTGYAWGQMGVLAQQWHSFGSGHRVGYYHWLYGTQAARPQFDFFWSHVAPVWRAGDWLMTDFEDVDPSRWVSDQQHLNVLRSFNDLCRFRGPIHTYTGNWYLANLPLCAAYLRTQPVVMSDYSHTPALNPYGLSYVAHQFTSSASVPGFAGRVDYNRWLTESTSGGGVPITNTPEVDLTPEESAQFKEMYGILHNFVAGTGRQTLDSYFNAGGTGQTRISQAVADEFATIGRLLGDPARGVVVQIAVVKKAIADLAATVAAAQSSGVGLSPAQLAEVAQAAKDGASIAGHTITLTGSIA